MRTPWGARDGEALRLRPGAELDGYVLERRVGFGGMAEVWLARRGETPFAIKVLHADLGGDPEFRDMFRDEIDLAQSLDHPNVVRVLDAREVDGALIQIMEWIDGSDLHSLEVRLERDGGRFPVSVAVAVVRAAACGLDAAHRLLDRDGRPRELVHRDVAPQNIMVGRDGGVKVVDFGVAKARNRLTRTAAGVVKGRLGYMAPEQAMGLEVTAKADVFALGVVAWELVAMDRMFPLGGGVLEVAERSPPPRLDALDPNVPPGLAHRVATMLAAAPDARPSMAQVIGELDALADPDLDLAAWCRSVFPSRRAKTAVAPRPLAPAPATPTATGRTALEPSPFDDRTQPDAVSVLGDELEEDWDGAPTVHDRAPRGAPEPDVDEAAPTDETEVASRGPNSGRTVAVEPAPDDETWAAPIEHARLVRGAPLRARDPTEPMPVADARPERGGWIHGPVGLGAGRPRQSFERTRAVAMTGAHVVPQSLTRSESGGAPMARPGSPRSDTEATRASAAPARPGVDAARRAAPRSTRSSGESVLRRDGARAPGRRSAARPRRAGALQRTLPFALGALVALEAVALLLLWLR